MPDVCLPGSKKKQKVEPSTPKLHYLAESVRKFVWSSATKVFFDSESSQENEEIGNFVDAVCLRKFCSPTLRMSESAFGLMVNAQV